MRKKQLCLILCALLAFTGTAWAHCVPVNYGYTTDVTQGHIRYMAQIASDTHYYKDYWGRFTAYSANECGTACISMALSYIGVSATPEDLGEYWLSKGYTSGVPFSTNFYDVPYAKGGHTFDFHKAYERYETGDGFSPVIIYLTRALNPYQTGNRHFVMLVGKKDEVTYEAIDPAKSNIIRDIVIEDEEDGTFFVSLESADGVRLENFVTEEELCAAQYYLEEVQPNMSYELSLKDGKEKEEQPKTATREEEAKEKDDAFFVASEGKKAITETDEQTAAKNTKHEDAASLPTVTPDVLYPEGRSLLGATRALSYLDVRIVFTDTGADTYTVYLRRAVEKGDHSVMNDDEKYAEEPLFCTVGDGYTTRYQGKIIFSPPICLRARYLYRYYVTDAFGVGSKHATYGYTGN